MSIENKKHFWLYVLKLKSGKYYVGITSKTPEKRYKEHLSGHMSAAWTRKYKPVKIHYTKDLGRTTLLRAEKYENKVVRTYIEKYGIENVRGGDVWPTEDLIIRFGWWWSRKDWESFIIIVALVGCLILASLYAYLK